MYHSSHETPQKPGLTAKSSRRFYLKAAHHLHFYSPSSGMVALMLRRGEEPQIVVPVAKQPHPISGCQREEVENLGRISTWKKSWWKIDGVETSISAVPARRGGWSQRFYVGQDRENSLIKLYNKARSNIDQISLHRGDTSWDH